MRLKNIQSLLLATATIVALACFLFVPASRETETGESPSQRLPESLGQVTLPPRQLNLIRALSMWLQQRIAVGKN